MAVLVLGAVAFWPGASTAQVVAGTKHSGTVRTVRLLDSHWVINKMPDFNRWKKTAALNASQLAQLHCPWPAGVWQPVQLPDDYIVAGKFTHRGRRYSYRDEHALHGYLPLYPPFMAQLTGRVGSSRCVSACMAAKVLAP